MIHLTVYILIINKDFEIHNVDEISDYFNEHCRNKCIFFGSIDSTFVNFRTNFTKLIEHLKEKNMEINKVYNEPCLETLKKMPNDFIDCVVIIFECC